MSVYIEFKEGEDTQMSIRLLKFKDGELQEVNEENDIEPNAYELYGLVLFNLIANGGDTISKPVFDAMEHILESSKDD